MRDMIALADVQPVLTAFGRIAIDAGREGWEPAKTLAALEAAAAGFVTFGGEVDAGEAPPDA